MQGMLRHPLQLVIELMPCPQLLHEPADRVPEQFPQPGACSVGPVVQALDQRPGGGKPRLHERRSLREDRSDRRLACRVANRDSMGGVLFPQWETVLQGLTREGKTAIPVSRGSTSPDSCDCSST